MRNKSPWVFNTRYTCPLLMLIQGWIFRQQWEFSEHSGWQLLETPTVIARCRFPAWLISVEYRLWYRFVFVRAWLKKLQAEGITNGNR